MNLMNGLQALALIAFGYLFGSIPPAYIAGKWIKGIDLRRYGSGTVSGSMVWEHVAKWAIFPVGLFDVAKAMIPVWLGLQLGLGEVAAAGAGLAAGIGHNWPIYLGFAGGRGLSTFLGIWLVLYPPAAPWMLAWLAAGWLLGDSAPFGLASILLLPVFSRFLHGPSIVLPISAGILLITLIKRLEANRRPLPPEGRDRWKTIYRRLVFDRDIAPHVEWIRRTPAVEEGGEQPEKDGR